MSVPRLIAINKLWLQSMVIACLCKLLLGWPQFSPYMNNYQQLGPQLAHPQQFNQHQGQLSPGLTWPALQGLPSLAGQLQQIAAANRARVAQLGGQLGSLGSQYIPISALPGLQGMYNQDFPSMASEEELFEMDRERNRQLDQEERNRERDHAKNNNQGHYDRDPNSKANQGHRNHDHQEGGNRPSNSNERDRVLPPPNEQSVNRDPFDNYPYLEPSNDGYNRDRPSNRIKLTDSKPNDQKHKLYKDVGTKSSSQDEKNDKSGSSNHKSLPNYLPPLLDGFEPRKSPSVEQKDTSTEPGLPPQRPFEVKRQTMTNPNGHLTFVTEMLYDVNSNPFKSGSTMDPFKPTIPPNLNFGHGQFLSSPSNEALFPPTDDPRLNPVPFTTYVPPLVNGNNLDWNGHHMLPTPPTPFKDFKATLNSGHRHHHDNNRPPNSATSSASNNQRKYAKNNVNGSVNLKIKSDKKSGHGHQSKKITDEGLGATAIAGIVIGSLVSVALLAGTALFVMYKSPFGSKATSSRVAHSGHVSSRSGLGGLHSTSVSSGIPVRSNFTDTPPNPGEGVRVYRFPRRHGTHPSRVGN